MQGAPQDWPLLVHTILDHAARWHGDRKVVARRADGRIARTTYADVHTEAQKITGRLVASGLAPGERVGALCWNTDRHLSLWYGVMGAGLVHHTVNPRLFEEQISFIVNDAEDRIMFTDITFLPLLEKLRDQLTTVRQIIVLADRADVPETSLEVTAWDDWLDGAEPHPWVSVPETAPCGMCYTSGTTGLPKGVVYSHRSNVLHALGMSVPDVLGLSARDVVMPIVPMFHANGWSLAFSAPLNGTALVLPGAALDGASVYELMEDEGVTFSAAVPTVWLGLFKHMESTGQRLSSLSRVVIGGSACPPAMTKKFEEIYGVEVLHAWGMTEMSPLGTVASLLPQHDSISAEDKLALKDTQGRVPYTVEMKVTDDENRELPHDGKTFGRLKVRGPAVAGAYFKNAGAENFDEDGWFDTGDVAHISPDGFMKITDRSKDVIKSGGEWISSIDLENLAMLHPDVAEAAVIGVPHPKWDERPLLVIVPQPGAAQDGAAILDSMRPHIAKWWLPDEVTFVSEIPHTATGKIQKTKLRDAFQDVYKGAAA